MSVVWNDPRSLTDESIALDETMEKVRRTLKGLPAFADLVNEIAQRFEEAREAIVTLTDDCGRPERGRDVIEQLEFLTCDVEDFARGIRDGEELMDTVDNARYTLERIEA